MKRALWWLLAIGGWLASLFLLADGFTFALSAGEPGSGYARGCYTAIDRLLDLKEPSALIRATEQVLGAGLFLGLPILGVVLLMRRWRMRAA